MAKYPDLSTSAYSYPLGVSINYKTLITSFDTSQGAHEQRKRKWLYPKRDVTLRYEYISESAARELYQFFIERSGSYDVFSFFFPESDQYVKEYVGTGDGSTKTFDLPTKNTTYRTVYVNSVEQDEAADSTSTGDFYIIENNGTDGCDQIKFFVAPNDGHRIEISFTGILKIRCRFNEDVMSYNMFINKLKSMGIQLKGLLNDE